jgi:putative NIF3 family GTP cyclohydrolase 1 type 2
LCGFLIEGKGNFRPLKESNPTIGTINMIEEVEETRIEVIVPQHVESKVLKALFNSHPYEEVAYSLFSVVNTNKYIGLGMVGELEKEMKEADFIAYLKEKMNTPLVRHSRFLNKPIKKVAVLGGSGAFAIKNAIASGADAYITSDLKYHEFFSAEDQIILMDIGHYESEQFTINLISSYLKEKFSSFVVFNSGIITNPVNYS